MDWPYEVNYKKENRVESDVLILGGGVAGCHAAIAAARKGMKVTLVEKGATIRSGCGGAGVDHWWLACTSPASKLNPDEMRAEIENAFGSDGGELGMPITTYITCKESYDALLDLENAGLTIRDEKDEFEGAAFRDEDTKLLFAYDYESKYCIRVPEGKDVKVYLHKLVRSFENIDIYDRTMATSLLTEDAKVGGKVIGATGLNVRNGEYYVFNAKSTVITMNNSSGLWMFSQELKGSAANFSDPNCSGIGMTMAINAGAKVTGLDKTADFMIYGPYSYPVYGTANAHNTWFACTIVDNNGKKVPWIDGNGKVISSVEDRYKPAEGQKIFFPYGALNPKYFGPRLTAELPELIKKGEYKLPLYADLPSMPEMERKAIWGLMVGNEGKTYIPIYKSYEEAGFNSNRDMLQANIMPDDSYVYEPWWTGQKMSKWKDSLTGIMVNWNLKTSLDGLYAAGGMLSGGANHACSASTGRYAGRNAATYAAETTLIKPSKEQVDLEKERIYALVKKEKGTSYIDLWSGVTRVMQDYCGDRIELGTLSLGYQYLEDIESREGNTLSVNNPKELGLALEQLGRLSLAKHILKAYKLNLLQPEVEETLKEKLQYEIKNIVIKQMYKKVGAKLPFEGKIPKGSNQYSYHLVKQNLIIEEVANHWWLKAPYVDDYKDNYDSNCNL